MTAFHHLSSTATAMDRTAHDASVVDISGPVLLAAERAYTTVARMIRLRMIAALFPLALGGCSYVYDLLAVVRDGHLTFIVDPASIQRPSCLRYVDVTADVTAIGSDGKQYDPAPGQHTAWLENVDYDDDCATKFPLVYGNRLGGRHRPEGPLILAKPLQREVVYGITTTTGATGYGGGRFVIHADGRVENLKPQTAAGSGNETASKP